MTNYQKIANTVKWLYQKGRAKHVTFIRRNELVEYDRPSEVRFFDAVVRIFDGSDLELNDTGDPAFAQNDIKGNAFDLDVGR